MEEYEFNDWSINNKTPNDKRRNNSIEAYYLPRWIDKVSEITFPTKVYKLKNCPDVLPFEECMVRYEHKSPSDSEHWGPVSTKEEALKLFYTSLVCRRGRKAEYICVRKYEHNLGLELRCFWNTRLVAVAVKSFDDIPLSETYCQKFITYINSISHKIPYKRCVMDICELNNSFIFIEFNSWETNSGSDPYDWKGDTEILYPENGNSDIYFRWKSGQRILSGSNYTRVPTLGTQLKTLDFKISALKIYKPNKPSNWLVTDKFIYIATEIWLGYFDHSLKALGWHRGVYRFDPILKCKNGYIYAGDKYFDPYLKPMNGKYDIDYDVYSHGDDYKEHELYRYGFHGSLNNQDIFCRMFNDGTFWVQSLN